MRVITHCPACQTQFFATEEQLNKHGGKVRCGQCMHIFDARAQLISHTDHAEDTDGIRSLDVQAPFIEEANTALAANAPDTQSYYAVDAVKKNKNHSDIAIKIFRVWFWPLASLCLILIAAIQSIYFLRNEIAIYYPNAKPYLLQACQLLSCSINLPKKIQFIMIDDSDMQEDADHSGLIRLASTLINSGSHIVAYPNLELTLTDVDDKPVLRRIFKPAEYLPTDTNIADGIQAGAQIRIKLAVTASDSAVAGYRVFVTY